MRYIFFGDIHGVIHKLTEAELISRFNPQEDTFVSMGDCFDRGPSSWKVLTHIMEMPNRILLAGNHDTRLRNLLLYNYYPNSADVSNGVGQTLASFLFYDTVEKKYTPRDIAVMITKFTTDERYKERFDLVKQYFDELVYAVEWEDERVVATHGVLPRTTDYWREAYYAEWEQAAWGDTEYFYTANSDRLKFKLIVGHWHTWRMRRLAGKTWRKVDVETGEVKYLCNELTLYNMVFLDGCTALPEGVVGQYVLETEETPLVYTKRGVVEWTHQK